MIRDELWCSIQVFGPQREIERFQEHCFDPIPDEINRRNHPDFVEDEIVTLRSGGHSTETWNFHHQPGQRAGYYYFAFDTYPSFPVALFERIASEFPALTFDCDNIRDNDSEMGYGWFNPPPGGEPFHGHYPVPRDYWNKSRSKRDDDTQKRYEAIVLALEEKYCQ